MNRLIIIGNGFDLAHKMKTSYNDFILWYLKKSFNHALNNGIYEDALFKIERVYPWADGRYGSIKTLDELIDYFFFQRTLHEFLKVSEFEMKNYRGTIYTNPFKTVFKSEFIEILIIKCSHKNWVDIENEFYGELKKILIERVGKKQKLEALNTSIEVLITELSEIIRTAEIKSTI